MCFCGLESNYKILDTLDHIERKMKGTDIKCHFANSGEEALKWMKQFHIDVMVTDVMMPDMNGLELSSKAKDISPHTCGLFLVGMPMCHQYIYLLTGYSLFPLVILYFFKVFDYKLQRQVIPNYNPYSKKIYANNITDFFYWPI